MLSIVGGSELVPSDALCMDLIQTVKREKSAKWTWPPVPTELITVLQKHWLSSAGTGVWPTDP